MIQPNSIQITPEILALIAQIDEFKGAWRALGTLAPDRLAALRRVASIESIGSSTRMAGGKLSDREVERLLSDAQIMSFTSIDEQAVAGYAEVVEMALSSGQDIPFTEDLIQQLHRDLLIYSEQDAAHRGHYNNIPNKLMTELMAWFNQALEARQWHPLLLIALWVVVFLEIHPFQDGNGRLSRLLTTLLLLRAGYAYVPYSSLENIIEQNRAAYEQALQQTQATIRSDTPDWQPWLLFFLRSLAEQARRLNIKGEREKQVFAALPGLSLQIVEIARGHGRVSMGDVIKLTGVSRNTLKQHFRALVAQGHLSRQGSGRGVWYTLK
jgi:Fic family protein